MSSTRTVDTSTVEKLAQLQPLPLCYVIAGVSGSGKSCALACATLTKASVFPAATAWTGTPVCSASSYGRMLCNTPVRMLGCKTIAHHLMVSITHGGAQPGNVAKQRDVVSEHCTASAMRASGCTSRPCGTALSGSTNRNLPMPRCNYRADLPSGRCTGRSASSSPTGWRARSSTETTSTQQPTKVQSRPLSARTVTCRGTAPQQRLELMRHGFDGARRAAHKRAAMACR